VNSLFLTLRGHCIETTAKERLKNLIRQSLVGNPDEKILQEIEFLSDFIKNTDFKRIRSQYPEYDGRTEIIIRITKIEDRSYKIESVSDINNS